MSKNYSDILPKDTAHPQEAISALVDKMGRFQRDQLFQQEEFIGQFRDCFSRAVRALLDQEFNKDIRKNLEYIMETIPKDRLVNIPNIDEVRHIIKIESMLEKQGVLQSYRRYSKQEADHDFMVDISSFEQYLLCLSLYAKYGYSHMVMYLITLVRFSQAEGAMEVTQSHLKERLSTYTDSQVENILSQFNYLGPNMTYEKKIWAIREYGSLSREEAEEYLDNDIEEFARGHLLLLSFWGDYIGQYFSHLEQSERELLVALFNDFRDIIDPGQRIPWVTQYGYFSEIIERMRGIEEGRKTH